MSLESRNASVGTILDNALKSRRVLFWICFLSFFQHAVGYFEGDIHFIRFTDAQADYHPDVTRLLEFHPNNAFTAGPSYWLSKGQHDANETVSWRGFFSGIRRIKGIRITFTHPPTYIRVLTSVNDQTYSGVKSFFTPLSTLMGETALDKKEEEATGDKTVTANSRPDLNPKKNVTVTYLFPQNVSCSSIRIDMRGATKKYIGINTIDVIGAGSAIHMIVGGMSISSPETEEGGEIKEELCLQVENGSVNTEGVRVVLDSCLKAIAEGDGRELFRLSRSYQVENLASDPRLCMAVGGDGKAFEGADIFMQNCERVRGFGDGRDEWIVSHQNYLQMRQNLDFCVSQEGDGYGFLDVSESAEVNVSSVSAEHSPEEMIQDGDGYWASEPFAAETSYFKVDISLSLPETSTERGVFQLEIDWEYWPRSFAIYVSRDAINWERKYFASNNQQDKTTSPMYGDTASYIRISILSPHPQGSHVTVGEQSQFIYGVRRVRILVSKLRTILTTCQNLKQQSMARGRYFFVPALEVDLQIIRQRSQNYQVLQKSYNKLTSVLESLEKKKSGIDFCYKEKKKFSYLLSSLSQRVRKGEKTLYDTTSLLSLQDLSQSDNPYSKGLTYNNPAKSCDDVVFSPLLSSPLLSSPLLSSAPSDSLLSSPPSSPVSSPSTPSGMYWILAPCFSHPLRTFCDESNNLSFTIWNDGREKGTSIADKIKSPYDIADICGEIGLSPLSLSSLGQLQTVLEVLHVNGYDELAANRGIPLAYDFSCERSQNSCVGKFDDFGDGFTETSTVFASIFPPPHFASKSRKFDTIGVSAANFMAPHQNLKQYNFDETETVAILCSANDRNRDMRKGANIRQLPISCDTSLLQGDGEHSFSDELTKTTFDVLCPPGCLARAFANGRKKKPKKGGAEGEAEKQKTATNDKKKEEKEKGGNEEKGKKGEKGEKQEKGEKGEKRDKKEEGEKGGKGEKEEAEEEEAIDIYGKFLYPEETPICYAAIYEGIIDAERGGEVSFSLNGPVTNFDADEKAVNSIRPMSLNEQRQQSYIVRSSITQCAIDRISPSLSVSPSSPSLLQLKDTEEEEEEDEEEDDQEDEDEDEDTDEEEEEEEDDSQENDQKSQTDSTKSKSGLGGLGTLGSLGGLQAKATGLTSSLKKMIPSFLLQLRAAPAVKLSDLKQKKQDKETGQIDSVIKRLRTLIIEGEASSTNALRPNDISSLMRDASLALLEGHQNLKLASEFYAKQSSQLEGVKNLHQELTQKENSSKNQIDQKLLETQRQKESYALSQKKENLMYDAFDLQKNLIGKNFFDVFQIDNPPPSLLSSPNPPPSNSWRLVRNLVHQNLQLVNSVSASVSVDHIANPGIGMTALLPSYRYYNFQLSGVVRPANFGRFGFLFRYNGPTNFYLFEILTYGNTLATIRLIKKSFNGVLHLFQQKKNIKDLSIYPLLHIKITAIKNSLQVTMLQTEDTPPSDSTASLPAHDNLIQAYDEENPVILSGSIGLYAIDLRSPVTIEQLIINPLPC